jgi:phosphatidylinositol alpha-1,6-mannosyltransferase
MSSPLNASDNKRILHITRNLPPLVGGMERLNWHMADELAQEFKLHIVAPQQSEEGKPAKAGFCGVSLKPLWLFVLNSIIVSIREARNFRPDVVIAGSGLTAPIAWITAKISGARSIVYLHGLDIAVDNALYRWLWLPFIRGMDKTITNSNFTADLAISAGINPSTLTVIFPGVELPNPCSATQDVSEFLSAHQLSGRKILLSVGRLAARKGILEFVSYALPKIVEKVPEAILVVIGDSPTESLHSRGQSKQAIIEEARKQGLSSHITFLGKVSNDVLFTAYRAASVHIFPVRHNPKDPEGFGMVAIEAAAYGLPTAAFATGGITDAVSEGVSGLLSTPGDYASLARNAVELIENKERYKNSAIEYSSQFGWKEFGIKIRQAIT